MCSMARPRGNPQKAARLKAARARHYKSGRAAALDNDWPESTYRSHEAGTRDFGEDDAEKYARRFQVQALWLQHGDRAMRGRRIIPVSGYVGAGQEVVMIDVPGELGEIEAPARLGPDGVALKVRGDSMRPAYRDGDLVFYDRKYAGTDLRTLIGEECVVCLSDDRIFVKEMYPGSRPGFWTLVSHNDAPRADVEVAWAAKVRWIERR